MMRSEGRVKPRYHVARRPRVGDVQEIRWSHDVVSRVGDVQKIRWSHDGGVAAGMDQRIR